MPKDSVETTHHEPYNISRLVFSGGGAKGAVYPGAYAALKETGVFNQVKHIAGSSAGAFTAALLSVGMSTHQFQQDLVKQNFKELLGELSENAWFSRDGKPLYDFLRYTITTLILNFLKEQALDETHPCWILFQNLEKNNHSPTFSDLEQLIKSWPNQFKRLTVTAVKENSGKLKIFNHHDTPHVEIALACKASGALPIFLTPVEIDGEKYSDGGIHDNIPTEFFDTNKLNDYENKYKDQTLVFTFLEGDKTQITSKSLYESIFGGCSAFNALYGSRKDEHDNIELFKSLLNQIEIELQKRIRLDFQNIPLNLLIDSAVNTVHEHYNWSWFSYVWALIVSTLIAIWTYICSWFSVSNSTELKTEDSAIKTQKNSSDSDYFDIIRDQLKKTVQLQDNKPKQEEHIKTVFSQIQAAINPEIYRMGPTKPQTLFNRLFFEKWAYNLLPKLFGSFRSNYSITDKIEDGFQKIRADYPLRTVGLGVGDLSAIDFDKATTHSRFLSARGYLDTILSISNHYLYHSPFKPSIFYSEIIEDFIVIYEELLETLEKNPEKDVFLTKLLSKNMSSYDQYQLIKETSEADLTSNQAFALTRATEIRRGEISMKAVFVEIDARCGILIEPASEIETPAHDVENPNRLFSTLNMLGHISQPTTDVILACNNTL